MKSSNTNTEVKKGKNFYSNMTYTNRKKLWGFLFLSPWLIGLLAFFLVPLFKTFYYSFFELTMNSGGGFSYVFAGLSNFKYALTVNTDFNTGVLAALAEAAVNVPVQIFISLFVAMLLNGKYKGRAFFRLVFFIPIILATGILEIDLTGVAITEEQSQTFLNASSIVTFLSSSGIPAYMLNALVGFANSIVDVITTAGVQTLIFLAGLQGISPTLYEVAKIEGCSSFESFCKITLPMISPMILVCLIYSLADVFANAEISDTINTVTFTNAQYGLGASMSAIYFLVCMAVIGIVSFIVSKVVFYYD